MVIVATQSMNLIDYFTPEEIVVVDRQTANPSFGGSIQNRSIPGLTSTP